MFATPHIVDPNISILAGCENVLMGDINLHIVQGRFSRHVVVAQKLFHSTGRDLKSQSGFIPQPTECWTVLKRPRMPLWRGVIPKWFVYGSDVYQRCEEYENKVR